jgi:hypothetical protein
MKKNLNDLNAKTEKMAIIILLQLISPLSKELKKIYFALTLFFAV